MDEETLSALRTQVRTHVNSYVAQLSERAAARTRPPEMPAPTEETWAKFADDKFAALLPHVVAVCQENGGRLPLTDSELVLAESRAARIRAHQITDRLEARLDRIAPEKRAWAEAILPVFRRANARMSDIEEAEGDGAKEAAMKAFAEKLAADMDTVTATIQKGLEGNTPGMPN